MRSCYGGHQEQLTCRGDEWILFDQIVFVAQEMIHPDAVNYCQNELQGQLWGDIDAPYEYLAVCGNGKQYLMHIVKIYYL